MKKWFLTNIRKETLSRKVVSHIQDGRKVRSWAIRYNEKVISNMGKSKNWKEEDLVYGTIVKSDAGHLCFSTKLG
jgi:3-oxoacyl-[acyl-carrier-protein] synthase III